MDARNPRRRAGGIGPIEGGIAANVQIATAVAAGVTPEAIRQRLSRARALLARYLAGDPAPSLAALKEVTT